MKQVSAHNAPGWLQLKKSVFKMFKVLLEEEEPVRNLMPAVIKIYDYYEPSKTCITLLSFYYVQLLDSFYGLGFDLCKI